MLVHTGISYAQVVTTRKTITKKAVPSVIIMTDVEFDAWYYQTNPFTRQSSKKMFPHNKRVDAVPSDFHKWCLERSNAGKS